jgi:hypothetical protein
MFITRMEESNFHKYDKEKYGADTIRKIKNVYFLSESPKERDHLED